MRRRYRPQPKHRQRCPFTGKVRYVDHADAVGALHHAKNTVAMGTQRSDHIPVRSYFCTGCNGYHTTADLTPTEA